MNTRYSFTRILLTAFCVPSAMSGQSPAPLRGTVVDPQGRPIAAERLSLFSSANTGPIGQTQSSDGEFELTGIAGGRYLIQALARRLIIPMYLLITHLAAMSEVRVWPSEANYLFVETPYASKLVQFAVQHDILIRDCTGWPGCGRNSIRLAVRRRWENERLLGVWRECVCAGF